MSKLSPLSHCSDVPNKCPGAAGYIASNMEQILVYIVTGKRAGPNKRGKLRIKDPSVIMGY
jgi:hypothetical protein